MEDRLFQGEDAAWAVARVLSLLALGVAGRLEKAPAFDGEDVHEARLACKRSRALWRLLWSLVPTGLVRAENMRLGDAARGLAAARDDEVLLFTVEKLLTEVVDGDETRTTPEQRRALQQVHGRLSARPVQDLAALQPALSSLVAALQRSAAVCQDGLAAHPGGEVQPRAVVSVLAPGVRRTWRRARKRLATCEAGGDDQAFHDWRKQVKYLWYQLQFLDRVLPVAATWVAELRPLQKALGEDHDRVVLAERLASTPEVAGAARDAVLVQGWLAARNARERPALLLEGRRLFALTPGALVAQLLAGAQDD